MPAETQHEPVRRRVVYSGRVQGVGFRFTANRIAQRHPVVGYVRNCADGTVELEVQGVPTAVKSLLDEIERRFEGDITDREIADIPCREPSRDCGFSIKS